MDLQHTTVSAKNKATVHSKSHLTNTTSHGWRQAAVWVWAEKNTLKMPTKYPGNKKDQNVGEGQRFGPKRKKEMTFESHKNTNQE